MSGEFKRSGVFELVGVFVVAGVAIVIALTMGQGEANPKLALGLIFGVIAIFVVALLVFQRSDLERAAGGGSAATSRAAAKGGRQVDRRRGARVQRSRPRWVRAQDGAPAAIEKVLAAVPNSTRWKRLEAGGGPEGIVLTRKNGEQSDWLCDLWLAERLASA
ncbi:MAG: hypothetical protein JWM24_1700 [Solirubrobacterales bacterium]|nr:hypothetical protein [Solirubrobacterales bacterium]